MIVIKNLYKSFEHKGAHRHIFKDASITIPSEGNIAVLGKDGSGKSVLVKLIGQSIFPDKGTVEVNEKVSWPVGFKGQLLQNLTGNQNIEFISMLMHPSASVRRNVHTFIEDYTQLDKHSLDSPIKTFSKSMRDKLSFAIAFAYDFETYLIDEFTITSESMRFIKSHRPNSRVIMVTKNPNIIKKECKSIILIKDHQLFLYDDINEGIEEYLKMFKNPSEAFNTHDEQH